MFEYILNFVSPKCTHPNALINGSEGYCPDCGAYVKKYFYIVRCSHCYIKREGKVNLTEVKPLTNFCPNCGGEEFYVERLEKIDITDIRFAIHRKEIIAPPELEDIVQIWVENMECPKMIGKRA